MSIRVGWGRGKKIYVLICLSAWVEEQMKRVQILSGIQYCDGG